MLAVESKLTSTLPVGVAMVSLMVAPSRLMRTEPVPVTVSPSTPSRAVLPLATAANLAVSVWTTIPSCPLVTLTARSPEPTSAVISEPAMVSRLVPLEATKVPPPRDA